MLNKGALSLLNDYGGDSSDEDVPGPKVSTKRTFKEGEENESLKKRLPLPELVFQNNTLPEYHTDDPALHGGRKRSFAHERGNWATFVYIALEQRDGVKELVDDILNLCPKSMDLLPCDDFHISLTKTVILRHHWITPFVDSIKLKTNSFNKFIIFFSNLKIYCNEERSRTFIGLQIQSGYDSLMRLVEIMNSCLGEFRLPTFYHDPSFHMSVAWCVGDWEEELNKMLPELNSKLQELMGDFSQENWYILVNYLLCKTGNKFFRFELT